MTMRYLTADEIHAIHDRVLDVSGGAPGVSDDAALVTIPTRVRISGQGQELFSDALGKASLLFDAILAAKPFHSGNKRTAMAAAAVFLRMNGQELLATDHEIIDLCLASERGSYEPGTMRNWFRTHTTAALPPAPPAPPVPRRVPDSVRSTASGPRSMR